MKRQLEQAIKSAGGTVKLAAAELGVTPATIRRWRTKGVPKRGNAREKLLRYKKKRIETRTRTASDLKKLKELRRMAVAKMKGTDQAFAPVRTFDKKMDGALAVGHHWSRAFNRELTFDLIDDIERWARRHRKKWPNWLMKVRTVQFSPSEQFAYPGSPKVELTKEVMVDAPEKNQFMAEMLIPSPRQTTMKALLNYMRGELEGMVTGTTTIYVLSAELFNYRLRPEPERKERARVYARANRKKTWKKKTAKKATKKTLPKKAVKKRVAKKKTSRRSKL